MRGTIARVLADKGYGFIQPHGVGSDCFFHAKVLTGVEFGEEIRELEVEYETVESEKGLRATYVKPAR